MCTPKKVDTTHRVCTNVLTLSLAIFAIGNCHTVVAYSSRPWSRRSITSLQVLYVGKPKPSESQPRSQDDKQVHELSYATKKKYISHVTCDKKSSDAWHVVTAGLRARNTATQATARNTPPRLHCYCTLPAVYTALLSGVRPMSSTAVDGHGSSYTLPAVLPVPIEATAKINKQPSETVARIASGTHDSKYLRRRHFNPLTDGIFPFIYLDGRQTTRF